MKEQTKQQTSGERLASDLQALLRARNGLIVVTSTEEERVEAAVKAVALGLGYGFRRWNCNLGVTDHVGKPVNPDPAQQAKTRPPAAALAAVREEKKKQVWCLLDFHHFWKAPAENRALRDLARELPRDPDASARTIVVVTHSSEVPPEFADHALVVEWRLPDREEMARVFDACVEGLPDRVPDGKGGTRPCPGKQTPPEVREACVDAAMGLSARQAEGAFSKSIVKCRWQFVPAVINDAKKAAVKAGSGIEYYDPDPRGLDGIGGNVRFKRWVRRIRLAQSTKARAFGLDPPKGVLLTGVPGCGKSAMVKALASEWGVPLLRLDLGAAKGGIVGESEKKLRECFRIADAIGKCIVWIDEIEKTSAGSQGGALDGGVERGQVGALLTWMEERKGGAFVCATANRADLLPAELMRKGRFDAIFFVDLPNRAERREILRVSLARVRHADDPVDLGLCVDATEGFAGVEVATSISDALFLAFEDGERPLRTEDVIAACREVVPLARTAPEKIKAIRDWAQHRARSASDPDEAAPAGAGGVRAFDVEDSEPAGGNSGAN